MGWHVVKFYKCPEYGQENVTFLSIDKKFPSFSIIASLIVLFKSIYFPTVFINYQNLLLSFLLCCSFPKISSFFAFYMLKLYF